ncbi:MAG: hypothetical protein MHM6MM_003333 [Cercozoa sp. M6MM]
MQLQNSSQPILSSNSVSTDPEDKVASDFSNRADEEDSESDEKEQADRLVAKRVFRERALALMRLKQFSQAADLLQLATDPLFDGTEFDTTCAELTAFCLLQQQQWSRAVRVLNDIVEVRPTSKSRLRRGFAQLQLLLETASAGACSETAKRAKADFEWVLQQPRTPENTRFFAKAQKHLKTLGRIEIDHTKQVIEKLDFNNADLTEWNSALEIVRIAQSSLDWTMCWQALFAVRTLLRRVSVGEPQSVDVAHLWTASLIRFVCCTLCGVSESATWKRWTPPQEGRNTRRLVFRCVADCIALLAAQANFRATVRFDFASSLVLRLRRLCLLEDVSQHLANETRELVLQVCGGN